MYIKSYKTSRFAGLKELDISFEDGLNVILGENESGKSTLIEGIHSTLFKDIKLRNNNNKDKEFKYKFMPRPKGDFIDGELKIATKSGDYILSKSWGSKEDISLQTPMKDIIKNELEIDKELNNILSFGESTYTNIVFAKQRDLKASLTNMMNNADLTREISDLLRMTLMELDGISIDEIERSIEGQLKDLYEKWDIDKKYPKNNRGINNPYKVGFGKILSTFYEKESLKKKMQEANIAEEEFEKVSGQINKFKEKYKTYKMELDQLESIEDDINKRYIMETKLETIKKELDELIEANKLWPMTENRLEIIDREKEDIEKELDKIELEEKNLEKLEEKDKLIKTISTIESLKSDKEKLEEKIKLMENISEENINLLEDYYKEILSIEANMKAGKIIAKVKKSKQEIYIINNMGNEYELTEDSFEEAGFLNFKYGDELELELKSSFIDVEELRGKYKESKNNYESLLEKLEVDSIEEAKVKLKEKGSISYKLNMIDNKLELLLENDGLENLKSKLKELDSINVSLTRDELAEKKVYLEAQSLELTKEKTIKESKIDEWILRYKEHSSLLDIILDKKLEDRDYREGLKNKSILPDEFKDVDEFRQRLSYLKENISAIRNTLDYLTEDYHIKKNNLFDESYEEIYGNYSQASKEFTKLIEYGEKLQLVKIKFEETKDKMLSDPMEPLVKEFTRLLDIITDGKYKMGDIDEDFNIRIENSLYEIPIDLLSAGTHDSVALALRFALLNYIFKEDKGYLFLDDCLVDLDPRRKEESIKLIKEFSKDHQIVFTTCDPATAKSLGGNIIEM